MSDLVGLTLEPLLVHLSRGGNLEAALVDLRKPLRDLRMQYRRGQPDFSTESARMAYCFAYHPYHAHLALTVLNRFADALRCDRPLLRLTIFGAGPAPELVALAQFLGRFPAVQRIEVDLIDREAGWENSRSLTIDATVPSMWTGELEVRHHTLDLTTIPDVDAATELAQGRDLIFTQALFTELRMSDRADTFMNRLMDSFGPQSLLLASDFSRMSGFAERLETLEARADLRALRSVAISSPFPRAPSPLRVLYTGDDGLIERRRTMVESRLYVRPGWSPPPLVLGESLRFVPDQEAALQALAKFVRDPNPGVFVLTGAAGTGKTQMIARAAADAESQGRFTQVWAPTGQAARRLAQRTGRSASTIHSALYNSPERIDRGADEPPQTRFTLRNAGLHGQVIFIDESSLIGNETPTDDNESEVVFGSGRLLDDILTIVTAQDSKVVFLGDRFQLAPYGEDLARALDPEFFAARNISVQVAELSTVNRQRENSMILELASRCCTAVTAGEDLPPFEPPEGADVQHLDGRDIPEWLMTELLGGGAVAITFRNADARSWNDRARRSANRPPERPVVGDHVVTVQAATAAGLMNGEELQVLETIDTQRVSIRGESVNLILLVLQHTDPGGTTTEFEAWVAQELLLSAPADEQRRVRRVLWRDFVRRAENLGLKRNTAAFFELLETDPFANALYCMYSYARTCQRAQGGEWEHAICDMRGTYAIQTARNRFGYTAVTRARSSAWLRDWPRGARGLRAERFEEFVEFALGEARKVLGEVVRVPENNGTYVSLRRGPGDREVVINLQPTLKAHVQCCPDGVDAAALQQVLNGWAAERLALDVAEPDECLEPTLVALHRTFEHRRMDLHASKPADYQVQFTLTAGSRRARIRVWHRATGVLTSEIPDCAEGDADLLQLLREMVDTHRKERG